jgi:hypothetical protein
MMKMTIRKGGFSNPIYEEIIGHENHFLLRVADDGHILRRSWHPGYPPILPPYSIEVIEVPVASDSKDTAANEVTGPEKSSGNLDWSEERSFDDPVCEHEGCHHRTAKRPTSCFQRRPLPCRLGIHGHYKKQRETGGWGGYMTTCLVCEYKWRKD